MVYLADVNLWVALAFQEHIHWAPANQWFAQVAKASCTFCRMTQQGFLRLATNPKAMGKDALTLVQAWQVYDEFLDDPRVVYSEEPAHIESIQREITQRQIFSRKAWTDAYLAAFAQAGGYELVTFDKGFSRFQGLKSTILS